MLYAKPIMEESKKESESKSKQAKISTLQDMHMSFFKPNEIKLFKWYKKTAEKDKGTKNGGWYTRHDIENKPEWLFKEATSYGEISKDNLQIIKEIMAILEVYAGVIYQLFLPDNTPKTRLVINLEESNGLPKFQVASKKIADFEDLQEASGIERLNVLNKEGALNKEIAKIVILAFLLGETDFNKGNFGVACKQFIKIDHGESLKLEENDCGNADFLTKLYKITDRNFLSQYSNFYANAFTDENIKSALNKIIDTYEQVLEELKTIILCYEKLLDHYRVNFQELSFPFIGEKSSTIGNLIINRFKETKEIYEETYIVKKFRM